jgi:hypothetical protein
MAKKSSSPAFDIADLVELLVHIPSRGKRVAIVTMQSETGPLEHRIQITSSQISGIVSILLSGPGSSVVDLE